MAEQLDFLTSSAVASPVRTSAPPAQVPDSTALARACGSTCSESCERCGLLGSLLKTSLRLELGALTGSSTTWKRQTTPHGRSWWVLTTSARPNVANAHGSSPGEWPTPTATPYGTSNNGSPGDGRETYATAGKASLETMAKEWVTPTASLASAGNRSRSGARKGELLLTGQAMQDEWPTPTSALANNGARSTPREATNGPNLHEAVAMWPTPHGMGTPEDPHGSELSMSVAVAEGTSTSERSAKRVGLWPTPRAEDSEQTGAHRGVPDTLTSAARMWPTATAGDAKASGSRTTANSGAHPGISLTDAAVHGLSIQDKANRSAPESQRLWVTPTARDWKDTPGQASSKSDHDYNDLLPRQVFAGQQDRASDSTDGKPLEPSRMLNADWVLQLMGYPRTWARLSTGRGSRVPEIPCCPSSPNASDECSSD